MRELRQSTSVDLPIGPFLDGTDGVTPETGLTLTQPDIRLKKNGGAWAQKNAAQTLSHEENGFYEVTLDTTDTNTLGCLRLAVFESGAAPVWEDFMVLHQSAWDEKYSTGPSFPPSAASIADAVWDELASAHQSLGTFGQTLGDSGSNSSLYDLVDALPTADDVWAAGTRTLTALDDDVTTVDLADTLSDAIFNNVPSSVWDEQVDGTVTARQSMRLANSANAGKLAGATTTNVTIRDLADTKNRIDATVDADGNRTAVTVDVS